MEQMDGWTISRRFCCSLDQGFQKFLGGSGCLKTLQRIAHVNRAASPPQSSSRCRQGFQHSFDIEFGLGIVHPTES